MNGSIRTITSACLLSFALGAGVGWWVGRDLCPRHWNRQERYHQMLDRFSSGLRLTPEQRTQVGALLETKRQKMDTLRAEMRPRFEEVRQSTQADIRRLLTPDQQTRFDEMEKDWQTRLKKRHPE